jgi:alpha-D-xyloside xylohydrolase
LYDGGRWYEIPAGPIPIVVLVRDHTVLPRAAVAQSTSLVDWKHIELREFTSDGAPATGSVALPNESAHQLRVTGGRLDADPLGGRAAWRITRAPIGNERRPIH